MLNCRMQKSSITNMRSDLSWLVMLKDLVTRDLLILVVEAIEKALMEVMVEVLRIEKSKEIALKDD